jgi:ParB-like nuclease domain
MSDIRTLPLAQLWIETARLQQRFEIELATVEMYAELYQDGHDLGPLVAFWDGDQYLVADGYHRYFAADRAGLTEVPVEVHDGTYRDKPCHDFVYASVHICRPCSISKSSSISMPRLWCIGASFCRFPA